MTGKEAIIHYLGDVYKRQVPFGFQRPADG